MKTTKTFKKNEKPKAKAITFDFVCNEREENVVLDFFAKYDGILSDINILLYMSKEDLYGTGRGSLPIGRIIEFGKDDDGFIITAVVYGNYVEKLNLANTLARVSVYTSNNKDIIDKFVLFEK